MSKSHHQRTSIVFFFLFFLFPLVISPLDLNVTHSFVNFFAFLGW